MMSVSPVLTNHGKSMIVRAIAGEEIAFTGFSIGSGRIDDETVIEELEELRGHLMKVPITAISAPDNEHVQISASFTVEDTMNDFVWRELGLWCAGEDGTEVLYAYANARDQAETMHAPGEGVLLKQSFSVVVAVGAADHVTARISLDAAYASAEDLDLHCRDKTNPHKVTKAQVGLGNVPNLAPSDMTVTYAKENVDKELASGEKLSTAFGKLARIVSSVMAHFRNRNNPHAVSCDQIGAAKKEHKHSPDAITGVLDVKGGGTGIAADNVHALRAKLGINPWIMWYTGDGSASRFIEVGFEPAVICVSDVNGRMFCEGIGSRGGFCSYLTSLVAPGIDDGDYMTDGSESDKLSLCIDEGNGFWCYENTATGAHTNTQGVTYVVMAWKY